MRHIVMDSGDEKVIGFVTEDSIVEGSVVYFFKEGESFRFDVVSLINKNRKIKTTRNSNLTLILEQLG